jgi:hypothetical protein
MKRMRVTTTRINAATYYPSARLVSTTSVYPLHSVYDKYKYTKLVEDMDSHGWIGRPILVEPFGDGFAAWTGSHRLAAARAAGLSSIPVVIIDVETLLENEGEPPDGKPFSSLATDDESRFDMLVRNGLIDAAQLMGQELQENEEIEQ